jgi:hypothetical protein
MAAAAMATAQASTRIDADHQSSSRFETAHSLAAIAGLVSATAIGPRRSSVSKERVPLRDAPRQLDKEILGLIDCVAKM